MVSVKELQKENEELKEVVEKYERRDEKDAKVGELLWIVFIAAVYFVAVHFITLYARLGVGMMMYGAPENEAGFYLFVFVLTRAVLLAAGIIGTMLAIFGVFEEELIQAGHRIKGGIHYLSKKIARETKPEEDLSYLDGNWEKKIGQGVRRRFAFGFKDKEQPRDAKGRFAKKRDDPGAN